MFKSESKNRLKTLALAGLVWTLAAGAVQAQPSFSKAFQPSTIGPGSTSALVFTITNGSGAPVTDLAFADALPAGVTIASPAVVSTDCPGALVSAPGGGGTISMTSGTVPGLATCTVTVQTTSGTPGTHMNVSGDLTSSAGNSGTASADLTVDADRPGFSKTFSPSTVALGSRTTLTFTVDNTASGSMAFSLTFIDNLPPGLVVADPAGETNTCTGGNLTAVPGTSIVSLTPLFPGDGSVAAGASCTLSVDVVSNTVGVLQNVSGDLTSISPLFLEVSGHAVAELTVTASEVALIKEFTDDPVPPGGTGTLEFTILNRNRFDPAVDIGFSDDLDATLSGLVAVAPLPTDPCGAGSSLSGTSTLSLSGGNLPPEGSCTFSVNVAVPGGATPGVYPNTTSPITFTFFGEPLFGSPATDDLFVFSAPVLSKTFLDDPVIPGASTRMEFTVTNSSPTSTATDISFLDDLTAFLPFPISAVLPAMPCGAGSSVSLVSLGIDQQGLLLTGGTLAAGASCTFEVTLNLPLDLPTGTYTNVTDVITATVDGMTATGAPATASFDVVAAPSISKDFVNDPVSPGDTVTLEFTLTNSPNSPAAATGINFTDDLGAALTGLSAIGLPMNDICGAGSSIAGTGVLSFTGGTLAPGESCTFSVTLQVPAGASVGSYNNTTSNVAASVGGLAVVGNGAQATLVIAEIMFTKEFIGDPVIPGDTVILRFSIANLSAAVNAAGLMFSDSIDLTLSGLTSVGLPQNDICGAGSSISEPIAGLLSFAGGNLLAGESCTFDVTLQVPGGAANGVYPNQTSFLQGTLGGQPFAVSPAIDSLIVEDVLLTLEKSFLTDPVFPGSTTTLEFTITNLDPARAASGITFTDDLDAALSGLVATGLPAADVCGAGSSLSGTGLLTLTGGNIPAGGSCTFQVTLQVPAGASPGTVTNTTSGVSGLINGLAVTGAAASDTLTVQAVTFSKSFSGPTTATGTVMLTFTIENLDLAGGVVDLSFSDDLDAVLTGLVATGLPMSDICGAGSTLAGTSLLTVTGANLGPGETCSFPVVLQVPAGATAGTYPNTTSNLTAGGLVAALPATADLVIEPPPTFAKAFAPSAIGVNGVSTLTFTIDNTASALAANSLAFTDNLPAGMVVATPPNATTTCGLGTVTAVAGSGVISLVGGTVPAGAFCEVIVDVTATAIGVLSNLSGDLTSTSGNSGTAAADLTVEPQPGFAKAFAPNPIAITGVSTLTFTIDNTGSTTAATGLDFTDNLPAGMVVATPANAATTCTGGTVTATSASAVISYTGGTVAAAATCTVQADVSVTVGGSLVNLSGALTSSLGDSGTATDTLNIVPPPTFAKSFAPNPIITGGVSTLTFTIDNTGSTLDATALDFTDNLPAGMVVATPANAATTCTGGTVTATSGAAVVSYTGGTVSAGATCTLQVDVTAAPAGSFANVSGDLTSSLGNSGTASDTLTVADRMLGMSKSFVVNPVLPGGAIDLEFTITNNSPTFAMTNIAFTDDLDLVISGLAAVGLPAADVCGAGSQVAGTSVVALTGGSLAPGASCTFAVTLAVPADAPLGTFPCTTSNLTATAQGGTVTAVPASADVTVVFLEATKAFAAGVVTAGGETTLEFTITNPDPVNPVADLSFTDDLDAVIPGMEAVDTPLLDVCGAGSQLSGTSLLMLTGGSLPPSGSCTFTVTLMVPSTTPSGSYTNITSPLEATVGGSPVIGGPASAAEDVVEVLASVVAIPTLRGWGMLLLIGLLVAAAAWRLRMG